EHTAVPMDESHWTVTSEEYRFEEYLGVKSIFLPSGTAQLNDVVFHNGVFEFDIAFPKGRGFPGVFLRIQDDNNAEELYVRPHQSGNPDANQYTPSFNRTAGWQLYHGDGYGSPVEYKYNAWNHVKLVISGTVGEVFINNMDEPLFQIYELKHGDKQGPIAIKGNANSHFANFSYSLMDHPALKLPIKELPEMEANIISNYWVSSVVEDAVIEGKTWLKAKEMPELAWHEPTVEHTGTINIAKNIARSEGHNTALVKVSITSDSDQIKRLDFGYSDEVLAYVNGKLVYGGNNIFRTRDYRYLGTIGFFDSLYLDLKKGDNEILFAIKEGFGGWGMKARIDDKSGLKFK
ncbi:MAG: hypothetical protein O7C75_13395, partial [Verrucomicrobia bacterium]|nr:hypothetical protein [Verrucomicrobiota bacterium]